MYTLVFDRPGDRPSKHYIKTKDEALNLARSYLLCKGMVTVFDKDGKEIYRHAQPWMREKEGAVC
jgi:hypothetical protein